MKYIILFLLFYNFFTGYSYGQVSGVSGSKVNVINSDPITPLTIEFEPLIESGWSSQRWNSNWEKEDLYLSSDSIYRFTSMAFRITYGLISGTEVGMNVSGDFEMISFGIKQRLVKTGEIGISILGGYNFLAGNQIYNISSPEYRHSAIAGGLAMTWFPSETFSLDVDLQVEPGFKKSKTYNRSSHFYLNADAGFYVSDVLQLVGGFTFAHMGSEVDRESANIMKFIPGFTVETGKNFILVGGIPVCIAGRNYECTTGFLVALTIIIE